MVEAVSQEVQAKEKAKDNPLRNVPPGIIAIALILLFFMIFGQGTFTLSEDWWKIALIIAIIYFMGRFRTTQQIFYTPREAKQLIQDECEYMRFKEEIEQDAKVKVGPQIGLYEVNGLNKHYLTNVSIKNMGGLQVMYRGYVQYFPPALPRIVRMGEITDGDEKPNLRVIPDEKFKFAQKYKGVFNLFGGGKG